MFYNYASSFLRFVHDGCTWYASYGGSKNLDIAAEIKRSNMLPGDRLGKVTKGLSVLFSWKSTFVFRVSIEGGVCFACCLEMFVPCVSNSLR